MMDRFETCELLCILNQNTPSECSDDVLQLLSENIAQVQNKRQINDECLKFDKLRTNHVDKYLVLNFHLLDELKSSLMASDDALNVLSLQQNKMIREALRESIAIGIRFNLQPKVPQQITPPSTAYANEEKSLTTDYDRLCYTTKRLIALLPCDSLRPLVVFVGLEAIMSALYQIIYCPLKKPGAQSGKQLITQELYAGFLQDKEDFEQLLQDCEGVLPKTIFVKETMLLLKGQCPWFKKAVSQNLTKILRSEQGLQMIVNALLEDSKDYDASDSTKSWKATDLITKLIISLREASDFEGNICGQLVALGLRAGVTADNEVVTNAARPYELIFAACVKSLYPIDGDACRRCLLAPLLAPLHRLLISDAADGIKFENNDDVTETLRRTMRLLKLVFADNRVNAADLPYGELTPCIVAIFRIYALTTLASGGAVASEDMAAILIDCLRKVNNGAHGGRAMFTALCDAFLFGAQSGPDALILAFRRDLSMTLANNRILISPSPADAAARAATDDNALQAHVLLKLFKQAPTKVALDLQMAFFLYLLNCLTHKEKYFAKGQYFAHLLVYSLLTTLAEDGGLQRRIAEEPGEILEYIACALASAVERGVHRGGDCEAAEFRATFLLVMILQALAATAGRALKATRVLVPLRALRDECVNEELCALVTSVIGALTAATTRRDGDGDGDRRAEGGIGASRNGGGNSSGAPSELDKAVADICDPLLPVRAHGLNALAKLIEGKHPEVLARQMYVLNIFQQNIKNDDSFIYLSAINGLAMMADAFSDTVLETLTDEYAGLDQSGGGLELRMKLGEVLIKVSRNLGDKASKYKSLLLNTFMLGAKDDDHLLRASSLSNLGEICQVLGYKLGAIVTEVLECVHSAIMTDPAVEARRAAVTVIRQLFVGLREETLAFLQEDIADVYRTLRRIYERDADDVMRLQAQLALEELEVNIQAFMLNHLPPNMQESVRELSKDNK